MFEKETVKEEVKEEEVEVEAQEEEVEVEVKEEEVEVEVKEVSQDFDGYSPEQIKQITADINCQNFIVEQNKIYCWTARNLIFIKNKKNYL